MVRCSRVARFAPSQLVPLVPPQQLARLLQGVSCRCLIPSLQPWSNLLRLLMCRLPPEASGLELAHCSRA